jgi:hypothetical protein
VLGSRELAGQSEAKVVARYFAVRCFFLASARRSVFFRRFARFLALSLPLLCPINLIFARFSSESKTEIGRHDPSNRERQGSNVVGASKTWRIFFWRQVVAVRLLNTFGQEA